MKAVGFVTKRLARLFFVLLLIFCVTPVVFGSLEEPAPEFAGTDDFIITVDTTIQVLPRIISSRSRPTPPIIPITTM